MQFEVVTVENENETGDTVSNVIKKITESLAQNSVCTIQIEGNGIKGSLKIDVENVSRPRDPELDHMQFEGLSSKSNLDDAQYAVIGQVGTEGCWVELKELNKGEGPVPPPPASK